MSWVTIAFIVFVVVWLCLAWMFFRWCDRYDIDPFEGWFD